MTEYKLGDNKEKGNSLQQFPLCSYVPLNLLALYDDQGTKTGKEMYRDDDYEGAESPKGLQKTKPALFQIVNHSS